MNFVLKVDDIPNFLSGAEKENALHICIKYYGKKRNNNDLIELKKQILNVKKNMLYFKTMDDKLIETELNSSRTPRSGDLNSSRSNGSNSFRFNSYLQNPNLNYADILSNANAARHLDLNNINTARSENSLNYELNNDKSYIDFLFNVNLFAENDLLLTNRSVLTNLALTNRTNKSVRFDDQNKSEKNLKPLTRNSNIDENEISLVNEKARLDPLTNQAVNERYKVLTDMVSNLKSPRDADTSPFSLSLPLTPRSLDGLTVDLSNNPNVDESSFISKEMSKSLENIYKEHNETFIKE